MATDKKDATPRGEVLVRAAKLRAKIMSVVKKNPGVTTAIMLVNLQTTLDELGVPAAAAVTQLKQLAKNNQLVVSKEEGHLQYFMPSDVTKTKVPRIKKEKKTTQELPNFTVDLVQSTGRVRVAIGGFVIDIGLAE